MTGPGTGRGFVRASLGGADGWRRCACTDIGAASTKMMAMRTSLSRQASSTNTPVDETRNVGRSPRTDNAARLSRKPRLRLASGEELCAEPLCFRDALDL